MKKVLYLIFLCPLIWSCTYISLYELTESAIYVRGDMEDLKEQMRGEKSVTELSVGDRLPSAGSSGNTEIRWRSSLPNKVSVKNNRIQIHSSDSRQKVKLIATVDAGNYSENETFATVVFP